MFTIDPIADLLSKIRNAIKAKKSSIKIQTSKEKLSILHILLHEGYIEKYEVYQNKDKTKSYTKVYLKYKQLPDNAQHVVSSINGLKQISKPGLRVYSSVEKLPFVLNGLGIAIISTNQGMMTDKKARKENIGGEIIAYVW